MKQVYLKGVTSDPVKLRHWFQRCSLLIVVVLSVLLAACDGSSDDTSPRQQSQIADSEVEGAAVKGPLKNASVDVFILDLSSDDLKGELVASGSTDENGAFVDLVIPGSLVKSAPFLIEVTDGAEFNDTVPVIPTLRTLIAADDINRSRPVYATPFSTFIIEMAKTSAYLDSEDSALRNFEIALERQADNARIYFGLGLLDGVDLFYFAPIPLLNPEDGSVTVSEDTVGYRSATEVMGEVVSQLVEVNVGGVSADDIFAGLAEDLADGRLDRKNRDEDITSLAGISDADLQRIFAVTALEIGSLMVEGSDVPVSALNSVIQEEALRFYGEETELLEAPVLGTLGGGLDSDGDGFADGIDAFPTDPGEWADVDQDGVGDNADGCIGPGAGSTDDDEDGVCSDEGSVPLDIYPDDRTRVSLADNVEPTAVITGVGSTGFTGVTVFPDASSSSDVESDVLTYNWVLDTPSGSSASLDDSSAVAPVFTPDVDGDYALTLTVFDLEASDPVSAVINASTASGPQPPSAQIDSSPADLEIPVGGSLQVTLDASRSSDANGDSLTYLWAVTDPGGSAVALSSSTAIVTTFNASEVGDYTVSLTANDGALNGVSVETLTTSEANQAPIADAGDDREEDYVADGLFGITVDASGSFDANAGDSLTYSWVFTGKPFAGKAFPVITNPNSAVASFDVVMDDNVEIGPYTLEVTVSDGKTTSTDEVTIDIQKPWLTAAMLYGSALVSFALLALPAQRRRRAARLQAHS